LALLPVAMYIVIRTAVSAWQRSNGSGDTKPSLVLEPMVNTYMYYKYIISTVIECGVFYFGRKVPTVSGVECGSYTLRI